MPCYETVISLWADSEDTSFDEADAEAMLKQASKTLQSAGLSVKLTLMDFDPSTKLGSNEDENIDDVPERCVAYGRGRMKVYANPELVDGALGGRGLKVFVCGGILGGGGNPNGGTLGVSAHTVGPSQRITPTAIVSTRGLPDDMGDPNPSYPEGESNPTSMGNTLAHELGHILCNGPNHPISPRTTPGAKGRTADSTGHDPCAPCNLMASGRDRVIKTTPPGTATTSVPGGGLTPCQIARAEAGLEKIAKKKKGGTTPQVERSIFDPDGDVGCGYLDIVMSRIDEDENGDVALSVDLAGFLPDTGNKTLEFLWAFDTDNSVLTGATVGPYQGVDVQVRVTLTGHYPYDQPGDLSAFLYTEASRESSSLPGTFVDRMLMIIDSLSDTGPVTDDSTTVPLHDIVGIKFNLGLLGPLDPDAPHGLTTTEVGVTPLKQDSTAFESLSTAGFTEILTVAPTIGLPGETISVTGIGFTAFDSVDVFVGNDLSDPPVSSVTADAFGAFSTSFVVPTVADGPLFVDALDQNEKSDFAVVTVYNARKGNVNFFYGDDIDPDNIANVLFINGSTGSVTDQILVVDKDDPFTLFLDAVPSKPLGPSAFALYVWSQSPDAATRKFLPEDVGIICLPTPLDPTCSPQPAKIANNTGRPEFGVEDWPGGSSPAPWTWSLPNGIGQTGTSFFQGIQKDKASQQGTFAVTNGIIVISN